VIFVTVIYVELSHYIATFVLKNPCRLIVTPCKVVVPN